MLTIRVWAQRRCIQDQRDMAVWAPQRLWNMGLWVFPFTPLWKKSWSYGIIQSFSVWMMFLFGKCDFCWSLQGYTVRTCIFLSEQYVRERMLYAGISLFSSWPSCHVPRYGALRDVALKNGRRYRSWSNEQRTVPGATIPMRNSLAYGFKLVYFQLPSWKITSLVIEL